MPKNKVLRQLTRSPPDKKRFVHHSGNKKQKRANRSKPSECIFFEAPLVSVSQVVPPYSAQTATMNQALVSVGQIPQNSYPPFRVFMCLLMIAFLLKKAEAGPIMQGHILTQGRKFDPLQRDIDVMWDANCSRKRTGVSAGKICKYEDTTKFLKVIDLEGRADDGHNRFSDALSSIKNFKFLTAMGVVVPEWRIVHEPGGQVMGDQGPIEAEWYLSTEALEGFRTADKLLNRARKSYYRSARSNVQLPTMDDFTRAHLLAHMDGEIDLARLAVAGMFIHDLAINGGNFGVSNNRLAVVDADLMPQTESEYYSLAAAMPRSIGIDFSMQTIANMGNVLNSLSNFIHDSVQRVVLGSYIRAINDAEEQLIDSGFLRHDNRANHTINEIIEQQMVSQVDNYVRMVQGL